MLSKRIKYKILQTLLCKPKLNPRICNYQLIIICLNFRNLLPHRYFQVNMLLTSCFLGRHFLGSVIVPMFSFRAVCTGLSVLLKKRRANTWHQNTSDVVVLFCLPILIHKLHWCHSCTFLEGVVERWTCIKPTGRLYFRNDCRSLKNHSFCFLNSKMINVLIVIHPRHGSDRHR